MSLSWPATVGIVRVKVRVTIRPGLAKGVCVRLGHINHRTSVVVVYDDVLVDDRGQGRRATQRVH